MTAGIVTERGVEWKSSACILCECNCGILVKLGGEDGRRFEQICGDKAHPASKGYTCQKALRLDHYQNGRGERVLHPLRRRADGSFEEISWDTAITEVAARLASVRGTYGGESILYYGGGGQGNHLGSESGAKATLAPSGGGHPTPGPGHRDIIGRSPAVGAVATWKRACRRLSTRTRGRLASRWSAPNPAHPAGQGSSA